MKKILHLINHHDWLYLLTIVITFLQMAYFIIEFFKPGVLKMPTSTPFLYFVILALWVIKKEIERWLRKKWLKKKGEFYVFIWLILTWAMVIISTLSKGRYQIPPKLVETVLYVVIIYVATCFSKYKRYKRLLMMKYQEVTKASLKQKVNVS